MGYSEHFLTKVIHLKNILKNVLVCLALATSGGAFAAGPLDGAYACRASYPGVSTFDVYMAIVTNAQGQTASAPVALTTTNHLFGYAIGAASTTAYVGRTSFDQPFSFVVNPQTLSFSGTLGVVVNGLALPAVASCTKIW